MLENASSIDILRSRFFFVLGFIRDVDFVWCMLIRPGHWIRNAGSQKSGRDLPLLRHRLGAVHLRLDGAELNYFVRIAFYWIYTFGGGHGGRVNEIFSDYPSSGKATFLQSRKAMKEKEETSDCTQRGQYHKNAGRRQ